MPAQWKTIGPLVGRTATQCQEHYEKLLDEAATGKDGEDDEEANLRSQPLRVGQIDSHPESKPARPDPIDMDEDEIEMLQEARARLANTQGKKAKRKAREKMLAQAKRLAELQKRRELKQAGLLSSQAKKQARKRSRDIDLGVEIPFHKPAPAGFHDVTSEAARSELLRQQQIKNVDFKKLNEHQYRSRDREAAQAKKREEARLRTLEKSNMQYVVAQVSKVNDPLNIRKRGPLELPEPTVTNKELQSLAKVGSALMPSDIVPSSAAGGVTQALLADYSDRPLPTPMRTPIVPSKQNSTLSKQESILRQASNLRLLERGQTPLLGGDNPDLLEHDVENQDGVDPAGQATPAPSNLRPHTPHRDKFGLNRPQSEMRSGTLDDSASVGASTFATSTMSIRELAREERRAAKRARQELQAALAALPAPQFDYELEVPMVTDEEEKRVETVMEEDAADIEASERRRLEEEAKKRYEARSSVVKRQDLPRPVGPIPECFPTSDVSEQAIDQERWTLLQHDAAAFPLEAPSSIGEGDKKKKKKKKNPSNQDAQIVTPVTELEAIDEEALKAAKTIINVEFAALLDEKIDHIVKSGVPSTEATDLLMEENLRTTRSSKFSHDVFTESGWKPPSEEMVLRSCELEFDTIEEATMAMRRRNDKTESKLTVLTGGLAKRAQGLHEEILQVYADIQNSAIEASIYSNLRSQEEVGAVKRIDGLRAAISAIQANEMQLYQAYQDALAAKGPRFE